MVEVEGDGRRRPCTGEPFTAERVAVFHEGRDATQGGSAVQRCEWDVKVKNELELIGTVPLPGKQAR